MKLRIKFAGYLYRLVLRGVSKKPAPETIPRTGPDAQSVDYYAAYLRAKDDSFSLLIDSVSKDGVQGRLWEGDKGHVANKYISWSVFNECDLEITHFYRNFDLTYDSALDYIVKGWTGYYRSRILIGDAKQFIYNKRRLARADKRHTLTAMVDRTVKTPEYSVSPIGLNELIYPLQWVYHPEKETIIAYNAMLLEALVESGDLEKDAGRYKLKPNALNTISEFEVEERRHHQQLLQQKWMKRLTLLLVLVGTSQVMISLFQL